MPSPESRRMARPLMPLIAGGLLFLTGCPGETPKGNTSGGSQATVEKHDGKEDDHEDDHDDHHHHHAEKGPHGGALVAIGHDDAHLEFVLDADTGALTAYVLDGEAEKPISIKQANLQLAFAVRHADDEEDEHELPEMLEVLTLAAVSPDSDGKASQFSGQADELKGAEKFTAALTSVTVGEKRFEKVAFSYPEGNEDDHHH